jgi:hypothetical protein
MAAAAQSPTARIREAFFNLALAIGITVAGLEVGYLFYSRFPYDPVGYLVGRDFVNTWVGGELALSGHPQSHFGVEAYNALLAEKFGPDYPLHIWSYPPHLLLFNMAAGSPSLRNGLCPVFLGWFHSVSRCCIGGPVADKASPPARAGARRNRQYLVRPEWIFHYCFAGQRPAAA